MRDRSEIEDLLLRYCRGVDRKDSALILACFHEDAVEEHGGFRGPIRDFVQQLVEPAYAVFDGMMHFVTNQLIEFQSPDVAVGEALVFSWARRRGQLPGPGCEIEFLAGRFATKYERRPESPTWKISRRTLLLEFGESREMNYKFPPDISRYKRGLPSPDDIVFHWKF
jgi:hypothetical protein